MTKCRIPVPKIGQKFDGWEVIGGCENRKVLCRCKCGTEKMIIIKNLHYGKSTKCLRCGQFERQDKWMLRMSEETDIDYRIIRRLTRRSRCAIRRCTNKNSPQWNDYGGRGIKVCEEWVDDVQEMVKYLLTIKGYDNQKLYLDRIDNNGNYEPGNIRFVTTDVSAKNSRVDRVRKHIAFSERRNLRIACGIGQRVVSESIGCCRSWVSQFESGKNNDPKLIAYYKKLEKQRAVK